jgi:alkylhydroperoxidase/carboxymuconolactone decarboxylase family protein YurZ
MMVTEKTRTAKPAVRATGYPLIEVITHLAFYAGWPNAMTAIMIAKEVFSKA